MIKVIFLTLLILCCNSCIKTTRISGHLFEEKEIAELQKAKSKQNIETILGSPTSVSNFGQETWYYITTKKQSVAFLSDKILEQNIIAISFKQDDSIDSITRYSEKDAKNHRLASETTIVKGNDASVAQQFFGNVGKFNKNKKGSVAAPRNGF